MWFGGFWVLVAFRFTFVVRWVGVDFGCCCMLVFVLFWMLLDFGWGVWGLVLFFVWLGFVLRFFSVLLRRFWFGLM